MKKKEEVKAEQIPETKIKGKKSEPRRFHFADEDLLKIAELQDACEIAGPFGSRKSFLGLYHLWRFIGERFPEVKTGVWTLQFNGAYDAYLVEDIHKERI